MSKKEKWSLWSLSSIPLIMTLGSSMIVPVLPKIQKELSISNFQVTMIITIYSVSAIFLVPIAGYLSDKWGRKKVLIPSLFITGIGALITAWVSWKVSEPYMWILIGRSIQGIGSAGAMPVVLPCVGDMFEDEEDVSAGLGLVETSNTFGKVLSPILGSFLGSFVWFLPFLAIPVLSIIAIILIAIFVKPPKNNKKAVPFRNFITSIKDIFKSKGHLLFTIFFLGAILMCVLFGILFYLSSTLEEKHNIDGIKKGFVLAIPLVALSITSYLTGKKIGGNLNLMKRFTCIGFFLLGCSFIFPLLSKNLYIVLSGLVISGIGIGMPLPSLDALITEGVEKEERGSITSLYSSMRFLGVAVGPPLFAWIMKIEVSYLFYLSIFLGVIGLCLAFFCIKGENN